MTTIETTADRETQLHGLAERLVRQNVLCCLSGVVATLAKGYGQPTGDAISDIVNQAFELFAPVLDYEEGARQAGWDWDRSEKRFGRKEAGGSHHYWVVPEADWQGLCAEYGVDPYEWEVFEHWAVTDWFAEKLEAEGERVDRDFEGLCVWARTTTGQAISADGVVRKIAAATL